MVLHGYTNPLYPMIKTSAAPDSNAQSSLKVALPSAAVAPAADAMVRLYTTGTWTVSKGQNPHRTYSGGGDLD